MDFLSKLLIRQVYLCVCHVFVWLQQKIWSSLRLAGFTSNSMICSIPKNLHFLKKKSTRNFECKNEQTIILGCFSKHLGSIPLTKDHHFKVKIQNQYTNLDDPSCIKFGRWKVESNGTRFNGNFTSQKARITEFLEANIRDKSPHLNRVSGDDGATTIKNNIEASYGQNSFIALSE